MRPAHSSATWRGVRLAFSSNSSWSGSAWAGESTRPRPNAATCALSASGSSASSEILFFGFATASSSSPRRCSAMRAMRSGSKRSVLYSSAPRRPSLPGSRTSERSDFEMPISRSSGATARPGRPRSAAGVFWSTSIAWNSGAWLMSRSGATASTIFSRGTSWCAYASSAAPRTRASSSSKVGSEDRSTRIGSVPTKKPMRDSSSARSRLATGVPTTMSSCPVIRERYAAKPASSAMKLVPPRRRPSASSASLSFRPRAMRWVAPRRLGFGGRGRSRGRLSAAGAPPSAFRQ